MDLNLDKKTIFSIFEQNDIVIKDHSKKRSFSFHNKSNGKSFLNNKKNTNNNKKSFFRIDSLPNDQHISNLIKTIEELKPEQINFVCTSLNLSDKNINNLLNFLESSINDIDILEKITNILQLSLYSHVEIVIDNFKEENNFLDCRYSLITQKNPILPESFLVGNFPFNYTFKCISLPNSIHYILQCTSINTVIPNSFWPSTLEIYINNQLIKLKGLWQFPIIDLSLMCNNSIVKIVCDKEPFTFSLTLKCVHYQNYDQLVNNIKLKKSSYVDDVDQLSLLDHFTGKLLKYPGKGINCTHIQCFNIKKYLERANLLNKWICPICRKPLYFNELLYFPQIDQLIKNLTFR